MKRVISLLMAVLMIAVCFAGCGGGGDDAETIIVGYTKYPPMNYMEGNELVGFDTELAEKVFTELGYNVLFKEIKWENKYTDLQSGVIDCIWNGFTCNSADDDGVQRSEKVDFSYKYMENRQVVVVKKNSGIASTADLAGKSCGAEKGSAGESYAKTYSEANYKGFDSQMDCLMELKSSTIEFAVMDALLVESLVGKGDYSDLTVVEALSGDKEYYAVGFEKGSDLTAKVNAQFEALAASGYMMELAQKYNVDATVIVDFADQK